MPDVLDSLIGIALVGYLWLAAAGKVKLSKDPEKNAAFIQKMAPVKILAPIALLAFILLLVSRLVR